MSDELLIIDFLQPLDLSVILNDEELNDAQLGTKIQLYTNEFPDLDAVDIVLLGIGDERGTGNGVMQSKAPDLIRKNLYRLYSWHPDLQIADVGTVFTGATLADTYAAAKTVIAELLGLKKTVIILGGSHDLTLAQYGAYVAQNKIVEVS